ncbi:MAG: adenosylcobinamide-GDP ribazoletransferase, partial [Bacteroidales bacterium]|nr:adenosylcobinamide-GDP ribazoletransferase [Bacteroidales bacterium]
MNVFLTALMFFTRIPVPASLPYSKELLNKALRFFPLVGGIVGAIGAGSLWLGLLVFPFPLALLLSILVTIFVTGAFHEDGFADFCDGYGGGTTKDKVLEIMKDSRLGTYGTVGLTAMLATKFMALSYMSLPLIFLVMITAHIFSRFVPVLLVYTTPYIREDALSKAKPIGNQTTKTSVAIALGTALIPLLFFDWPIIVGIVIISAVVLWLFRAYIMKRTGGYSG